MILVGIAILKGIQKLALPQLRFKKDEAQVVRLPLQYFNGQFQRTLVLYMSFSFWLLRVESQDFSQAEKERTACKAKQIHNMTTIFTQNGPWLSFRVKIGCTL